MGWLSNAVKGVSNTVKNVAKNPVQAIAGGSAISALAGPIAGIAGGALSANATQAQKDQQAQMTALAGNTSAANLTPAQQQLLREQDISRGQARGEEIFQNDPVMKDLLAKRQSMAQGVNAQEYQGMRDDMIKGQQGANAGYMRQLLSAQGQGGVGGARAVAQRGELVNQFANTRADAERKLLLDNIALKNQGTDSLQDFLMKQKYGTLAQGLGEAQLGVADRTGYLQGQIGQQMAAAAAQQPKQGLLGQVFGGLF